MRIFIVLGQLLIAAALMSPNGALAQSRTVQCFLEINNVHYLGTMCSFMPLDKRGSFRIVDTQGRNLIAQINVKSSDEGSASWNGPIGGSASSEIMGVAYRQGGCWIGGDGSSKYKDIRICAWDLKERIYLGPTPNEDFGDRIIYYGSKVGMFFDIESKEGIGTQNARLMTKPSRNGAILFCREYSQDYSLLCINEVLGNPNRRIMATANCTANRFVDFNGSTLIFAGLNKNNDDVMGDYIIKDLKSGEVLDGSSASGYDVALGIFSTLCPKSVPTAKK